MDFFKKIGNTISSTSKEIAEKTKEISEVSKIKSQISTEEKNINENILQIGKIFFEKYSNNEIEDEDLKNKCELIKESKLKIEGYNEAIQSIKGITICPNCNTQITEDSIFCPKCGAKLTQEEVTKSIKEENSDNNEDNIEQ